MMETISTPGAISKVTSQLTAPWTSFVTFPLSTLRALIFVVDWIVSNGSRHSNRIVIRMVRVKEIHSQTTLSNETGSMPVRGAPRSHRHPRHFARGRSSSSSSRLRSSFGIEVEAAPAHSLAFFSLAAKKEFVDFHRPDSLNCKFDPSDRNRSSETIRPAHCTAPPESHYENLRAVPRSQ